MIRNKTESANTFKIKYWIQDYFNFFPKLNPIIVSIITGIIIYTIGLIISFIGKFHLLYIKTYVIYLSIFGIIWVLSWVGWGHKELLKILTNLLLTNETLKRKDIISSFKLKLKLSTNPYVIFTISLLLTLSLLAIIIIFWVLKIEFFQGRLFFAPIVPEGWFIGKSLYLKLSILIIHAIPVGFLLGTTGYLIITYNFLILNFLSKHFCTGPPLTIPQRLRPITILNLKAVFSWFIGVAIAALAMHDKITVLGWVYLSIFIIIGLIFFFFPQILFHNALQNNKDIFLKKIGRDCDNLFTSTYGKFGVSKYKKFQHLVSLYSIYKSVKQSSTWILDYGVFFKLMLSAAIPIIAVYIRIIIEKSLS